MTKEALDQNDIVEDAKLKTAVLTELLKLVPEIFGSHIDFSINQFKSKKNLVYEVEFKKKPKVFPKKFINLLTKKANVLYYIQMERTGGEKATKDKKSFTSVVEASKEAIEVYKSIIRDFKTFKKIPKVLYLLAVTYHSIGETNKFMVVAEKVVGKYSETIEAMRARLLLGKHHFNEDELTEALSYFKPVITSEFTFERNQAKFYMGHVHMRKENYKSALKMFEDVIVDEDLEEEDSVKKVMMKTHQISSSLKREALINSLKAFTYV